MAKKFLPPFQLAGDWTGKAFKNWPLLRAQVKVDGVRGWWDGEAMWTRGGKQVSLPDSWDLPKGIVLDGEIAGLDVSEVSGAVMKGGKDPRWESLRFHVFDVPEADGDYDQRFDKVVGAIALKSCCELSEVRRVPSEKALADFCNEVSAAGGEGLILRLGSGKYVAGEKPMVAWKLKLKKEYEATVVRAFPEGKKRIECKWANGTFRVSSGITKAIQESPPAEGTPIIFTCGGLTANGNPRHPALVRIRDVDAEGEGRPAPAPAAAKKEAVRTEKRARVVAGLSAESSHQVSKRLEMVPLEQLIPFDERFGPNPRQHGEDLPRIRKSVEEYGFIDPLLIDEENVVLDGAGRVLVAKEFGLKRLPCIRISGLPVAKKRIVGLTLNNIQKKGVDDEDALARQLAEAMRGAGATAVSLVECGFDEALVKRAVAIPEDALKDLRKLAEDMGGGEAEDGEDESKLYRGFRQKGDLVLVPEKVKMAAEDYRTPLVYHGGKSMMIPILRPLVESVKDATFYYEAYGGGLALLWSLRVPFPTEVISDRSDKVIDFWEVMKSDFDSFHDLAQRRGMHSEKHFLHAQTIAMGKAAAADKVENAWALWYCTVNAGSFDGRQNFLLGYEDNKAEKFRVRLDKFTRAMMNRLRHVTVMCEDAVHLIRRFGSRRNVLIFCDPPYVGANQGLYSGYTQEEFDNLMDALAACQCRWILTSYENDSLEHHRKKFGWKQARLHMHSSAANTHSEGPREKVECVTTNFETPWSRAEQ